MREVVSYSWSLLDKGVNYAELAAKLRRSHWLVQRLCSKESIDGRLANDVSGVLQRSASSLIITDTLLRFRARYQGKKCLRCLC